MSLVARQRDLRELVGENFAGSLQLQFSDALKYWEARSEQIRLEDRNLPVIAERRVLRPVDERARAEIDGAFDALRGLRADVSATLLTDEGKWQEFRQVYPFSPALVQTLIAVSSVLQRERTAVKLMQQLLVDRRANLDLGQLIPVGDPPAAGVEGRRHEVPQRLVHDAVAGIDRAAGQHPAARPQMGGGRGVVEQRVEQVGHLVADAAQPRSIGGVCRRAERQHQQPGNSGLGRIRTWEPSSVRRRGGPSLDGRSGERAQRPEQRLGILGERRRQRAIEQEIGRDGSGVGVLALADPPRLHRRTDQALLQLREREEPLRE